MRAVSGRDETPSPSPSTTVLWELPGGTHLELHVAGAGRLGAGGGDLLGQVGGRDDLLGERHAVVLQVHAAQLLADDRVVVHHAPHVVEQLDDQLRHVVAGGRLKYSTNTDVKQKIQLVDHKAA